MKAKVNKKVKKALLDSGAFDTIGGRKKWIFNEDGEKIPYQMDINEMAQTEKEYLGFSLSRKNEVDIYKNIIEDTISDTSEEFEDDSEVCVGGEVVGIKVITTKRGDKMAFVNLVFNNDDFSLTLFPERYKTYDHLLGEGNALLALGSWDAERNCVVVKNMCTAEQLAVELQKG